MNLCDECQTAAHCLRNGCIPIQPAPEPAEPPRIALPSFESCFEINEWGTVFVKPECSYASLLPTKEQA